MLASRDALLARGILYPDVELDPEPQPKHQWLVNLVLTEDWAPFGRNIDRVVAQARETNASHVVLSTEGLFNHWFDFSAAGKAALASLKERFDVSVWVLFRDPVSWAVSMYIQAVRNPLSRLSPVYSTTEALDTLIDHEFFATRLRYDRYVQDVERVFGEGKVHPSRYESGDVLEQARRFLGVDATVLADVTGRNRALSMLGVELLRRLNGLRLAAEERERVAAEIARLDETLGASSEPLTASPETRRKVLALSRDSEDYLERRFGISWTDCRTQTARNERVRQRQG